MATELTLQCPACGGRFEEHVVDSVTLFTCRDCGGVWFRNLQISKIVKDGPKTLDELMGFEPPQGNRPPPHATLKCPTCALPLHTNFMSGMANVKIHTCYECAGLFLEAADLAQLDSDLKEPGKAPLNPVQAQDALEEKLEVEQLDSQIQEDRFRTMLVTQLYRRRII